MPHRNDQSQLRRLVSPIDAVYDFLRYAAAGSGVDYGVRGVEVMGWVE